MLIESEVNEVIPSLPYTKDLSGLQYKKFIDYRIGKYSNELPLPETAYWKSLEDILTQYVRHNDNKFNYVNGIAQRKHITVDRIRYIGKESNNLDEVNVFGVEDNSIPEYENKKEFYEWVLVLKPKDVKDKGISEKRLRNFKQKIRNGLKNLSKITRILFECYLKSDKSY